jgi:hydroxysqualene dehydroxylase
VSAPGKVVVVGGGLAGITAAIALSEAGADVTLAEAKPRLGGATSSFSRGGLMVDTGQHVFLRCCVAYRGLLARLGVTGAVTLQDRFDVTVLAPGGRARLRRTALPGPLHLGKALLGYGFLSRAQRLSVARAALAMAALNPAREDLDRQRLGDWLAARGQDEQTRRLLWDLFTVSALNTAGDDANLALAATVVKTGLLGARDAADIGVPSIPLGQLHGQAAGVLLTRLGAQVRLSTKVAGVEVLSGGPGGQGARFLVRLAGRGGGDGSRPDGAGPGGAGPDGAEPDGAEPDGAEPGGAERYTAGRHGARQVIEADGVVLAVPPAVAARLAPAGAVPGSTVPASTVPASTGSASSVPASSVPANPDSGNAGPGPAQWRELSTSPIVNVHVMYDRRVTRLPFAAAVNSPVQWVFDRTGPSGLRSGQYLAVSLSAADDYVDVPASALRKQFLPAMADLFPAVRDARVTDIFVTRERRATLRQVPGCERLRPKAATALPGLVLAGAWTDTGWPDTMEGAVRSGLNAARTLRHGMTQGGVGSPARPAVSAGPARDRSRTRRPTRRPGQVNGSAPVNTRNAVNARDAVDVPDAVNGPAGTGATA